MHLELIYLLYHVTNQLTVDFTYKKTVNRNEYKLVRVLNFIFIYNLFYTKCDQQTRANSGMSIWNNIFAKLSASSVIKY